MTSPTTPERHLSHLTKTRRYHDDLVGLIETPIDPDQRHAAYDAHVRAHLAATGEVMTEDEIADLIGRRMLHDALSESQPEPERYYPVNRAARRKAARSKR